MRGTAGPGELVLQEGAGEGLMGPCPVGGAMDRTRQPGVLKEGSARGRTHPGNLVL